MTLTLTMNLTLTLTLTLTLMHLERHLLLEWGYRTITTSTNSSNGRIDSVEVCVVCVVVCMVCVMVCMACGVVVCVIDMVVCGCLYVCVAWSFSVFLLELEV